MGTFPDCLVILVVCCTVLPLRLGLSYTQLDRGLVHAFSQHDHISSKGKYLPKCDVDSSCSKFDCHPGPNVNKTTCEAKGCCWKPVLRNILDNGLKRSINVPYCYYPRNFPAYQIVSTNFTKLGVSASLQYQSNEHSGWPSNIIPTLQIDVFHETEKRLHFKIYDPSHPRYEVPIETPKVTERAKNIDYLITLVQYPFGIRITRKSTGSVIFESTIESAPFMFADQFIQITTKVASGLVYGLGEHQAPFLHNLTAGWKQLSFWARDQPPTYGGNLYGVHPVYLSPEQDGNVHGVFLLNSNSMDVDMQPYPALTYRTIGGIMDFYVFLGPTANDVIAQYTEVIGRPKLPPYWGLGFHLCRWGYGGTEGMKAVIARMRAAKFPYDTQWNDIDYMDHTLDWTYDRNGYAGLSDIIKDLHDHNQHYVIIVDPGISNQHVGKYPPYDVGIEQNVFVLDGETHTPIVGSVWPGFTVFPDFSHPNVTQWWYNCASNFHKEIPFDGLWTDMNEPSNALFGSTKGCRNNKYNKPPYTPGVLGEALPARTLCPSAMHYGGLHYDLHSLYGHMEVKVTHEVLEKLTGKRSFIISRSTFASTGKYGGHWSGDVASTWSDLYFSIPAILNFQMFGIPFIGADICGFAGDTTEELCTRWMQLGAFYPFMRNHNSISRKDQDPAVFSVKSQDAMRKVLLLRYSLLPYLYTSLYQSLSFGFPVVRPIFYQYPKDKLTYSNDKQFMWGDALLISPVLQQGQITVEAYIPYDRWFDYHTGAEVMQTGSFQQLQAPLDHINVHIRGGTVLPIQQPSLTTVESRLNPFNLTIALDMENHAKGSLYIDDGETIDATEKGLYAHIEFHVTDNTLMSQPMKSGYRPQGHGAELAGVTVMGLDKAPVKVLAQGKELPFSFSDNKVLSVGNLGFDILKAFKISWTF